MPEESSYVDQVSTTQPPDAGTVETAKKSYHAPRLRDYGHIRDITMTTPGGANYDAGGVGPNYIS